MFRKYPMPKPEPSPNQRKNYTAYDKPESADVIFFVVITFVWFSCGHARLFKSTSMVKESFIRVMDSRTLNLCRCFILVGYCFFKIAIMGWHVVLSPCL